MTVKRKRIFKKRGERTLQRLAPIKPPKSARKVMLKARVIRRKRREKS